MITDEMIFYGGIIVAIAALAAGIISFFIFKIKKMKLDAVLDMEYGSTDEKKKSKDQRGKDT